MTASGYTILHLKNTINILYFIIAQSETMCSQLSIPTVLLFCSYILPASWQKDKRYMSHITFSESSSVFQVVMSLSTIAGLLPH